MKPLHFIPLLIAIGVVALGWMGTHPLVILVGAVLNLLVIAGMRRAQIANEPQRVGRPNMISEGAYLLVLQVLILAAAYFLGYFLANAVGT